MRKQIVAGNWKMNTNFTEAKDLARRIQQELDVLGLPKHHKVILCPPTPFLQAVKHTISWENASVIKMGAQNCHQHASGAFTGETAPQMLESLGINYVIIGHSERRKHFKEDNALLKEKVDQALHAGLQIIFCCGESLAIRTANQQLDWVSTQIRESLFHLTPEQFANVIIAYEPIWAIGTGETATPEQAEAMHQDIRHLIAQQYEETIADQTSILYGGSCKPSNAKALFSQPNVDGGLIGGASLQAYSFVEIIECL